MSGRSFSPEQIADAIGRAEAGTVVGDVRRKPTMIEATLARREKSSAGLGLHELRELQPS